MGNSTYNTGLGQVYDDWVLRPLGYEGLRVHGVCFRVQSLGFRVEGLGLTVQSLGFQV